MIYKKVFTFSTISETVTRKIFLNFTILRIFFQITTWSYPETKALTPPKFFEKPNWMKKTE